MAPIFAIPTPMKATKLGLLGFSLLPMLAAVSCDDAAEHPTSVAGRGGAAGASAGSSGETTGGRAGAAGMAAAAGKGGSTGGSVAQGGSNDAGAGGLGAGGDMSVAGAAGAPEVPAECGDPQAQGVVVSRDITLETTWSCPVYTLTRPIYVRSSDATQTVLRVEPGVTVRGLKGVPDVSLPGALIITRSGRIDAIGTPEQPITFTTAEPAANWAPGSWGGLVMLGRAPVNAPTNFENLGLPAGEVFAEALPKNELGIYGSATGDDAGAGGAPSERLADYSSWNCGIVRYTRVLFAGFIVGSGKELNGITLAGCGSETVLDHVQVHRCSDDGIEIFAGSPQLSHVVLTGNQDDQLDWDQGFRGKMQFLAMQAHEDADQAESCGIEADGYATPAAPVGLPSAPELWNMTMLASKTTARGVRFRDGTQGFIGNSLLVAHADGVKNGLIDIDHPLTADYLAAGELRVEHSIFRGSWPALPQADSLGTDYREEDYFTGNGPGATGNDVISAASELWLNAFNQAAPEWVPAAGSLAASGGVAPSDGDGDNFFDDTATYRGAFEPGGEDWTAGWTTYP